MVSEKLKEELKRFLSAKQVEGLSKQWDAYEVKVREAVKEFDIRGREAKSKGKERLDKFAAQLKRSSEEFEKHFKAFMNQEGKVLGESLTEMFAFLSSLAKSEPAKKTKSARSKRPTKTKKAPVRKTRSATLTSENASAN
jgi:hypothetical protein